MIRGQRFLRQVAGACAALVTLWARLSRPRSFARRTCRSATAATWRRSPPRRPRRAKTPTPRAAPVATARISAAANSRARCVAPTFSLNWGGKIAETLFTFIATKMPPANPGSLGPDTTAAARRLHPANQRGAGRRQGIAHGYDGTGRDDDSPWRHAAQRADDAAVAACSAHDARGAAESARKIHASYRRAAGKSAPGDWLIWRRTYDDQGFSPLKQINKSNVSDLRVAWAWSLPNGQNEATPLEHDGVLFVAQLRRQSPGSERRHRRSALAIFARNCPSDARLSCEAQHRDLRQPRCSCPLRTFIWSRSM